MARKRKEKVKMGSAARKKLFEATQRRIGALTRAQDVRVAKATKKKKRR